MRAIVAGQAPEIFDESPTEHVARAHPDPVACQAERRELEAQVQRLIAARANAQNN
jgi:hypothetical protein